MGITLADDVVNAIRSALKTGGTVSVEDCIAFVEANGDGVFFAYIEAAKLRGVRVNRDEVRNGCGNVLKMLERERARYTGAYITGLRRSGRS